MVKVRRRKSSYLHAPPTAASSTLKHAPSLDPSTVTRRSSACAQSATIPYALLDGSNQSRQLRLAQTKPAVRSTPMGVLRVVEAMRVDFGNVISAPATARHALKSWLGTVDCTGQFRDDALLVVSELVTNVVIHTTSGSVVIAAFDDHRLRIEVHDCDPRWPVVVLRTAVAGRGLSMVEAHCDLWGWEPTAFGKRVWTETLC